MVTMSSILIAGRTYWAGPVANSKADHLSWTIAQARMDAANAVREAAAANGDAVASLLAPGPARFAQLGGSLSMDGFRHIAAMAVAAITGLASIVVWVGAAVDLHKGIESTAGCVFVLGAGLAFSILSAFGVRDMAITTDVKAWTGRGMRLAEAAREVVAVGNDRIYVGSCPPAGPFSVREIHYDALGSAVLKDGVLSLSDRAGRPLASLVDPISEQGLDPVDATRRLRSRVPA